MTQILQIHNHKGFTLLELLVAITIGSIILTSVYYTFSIALKTDKQYKGIMEPLQQARFTFDNITKDVRNIDQNITNKNSFKCEKKSCLFPVLNKNNEKQFVKYNYINNNLLIREVFKNNPIDSTLKALQKMTLANQVSLANFFLEKNDKSNIPKLVGINLNLVNNNGSKFIYTYKVALEVSKNDSK